MLYSTESTLQTVSSRLTYVVTAILYTLVFNFNSSSPPSFKTSTCQTSLSGSNPAFSMCLGEPLLSGLPFIIRSSILEAPIGQYSLSLSRVKKPSLFALRLFQYRYSYSVTALPPPPCSITTRQVQRVRVAKSAKGREREGREEDMVGQ